MSMTRDQFVHTVAKLVEGLAAPASVGGPKLLGMGYQPWEDLHRLAGFGWHSADDYERAFWRVLEAQPESESWAEARKP